MIQAFALYFKFIISVYPAYLNELNTLGTVPDRMVSASACYHKTKNQILLYGGILEDSLTISDHLYYYDIDSKYWSEYIPQSLLRPPGLFTPKMFVGQNNKLYVIHGKTTASVSADVFSFDFLSHVWKNEELLGDYLPPTFESAYCEYYHNSVQYFGIYGGLNSEGVDGDLYIITVSDLTVRKMNKKGNYPGSVYSASLTYDSGLLYLYGNDESLIDASIISAFSLDEEKWSGILNNSEIVFFKTSLCSIVNDTFYVFFGYNNKDNRNILKYSLLNHEYTEIENSQANIRSSFVKIDNKVYSIAGTSSSVYENYILAYTILQSSILQEQVYMSFDLPPKRKNHAMFTFSNKIFIFGGRGENNEFLNDLWKYDLDSNTWQRVQAGGSVPDGRELMGYSSLNQSGFIIYGGRNDKEVLSDAFYFVVALETWIDASSSTLRKFSRFSVCLYSTSLKFVIVGGRDNYRNYRNILVFDFMRGDVFASADVLPEGIKDYQCGFWKNNSRVEVLLVGGRYSQGLPYGNILKLSLELPNKNLFDVEVVNNNKNLYLPSESSLVQDSDYIYLIGGTLYYELIVNAIYKINIRSIEIVNFFYITPALGLHSHTSVHLGSSIYIFGGSSSITNLKISLSPVNSFYLVSFTSAENNNLTCSHGPWDSSGCKPCSEGTYFNSSHCVPCPVSRFSTSKGVKSILDCSPCGYGTFTDTIGSIYCRDCLALSYCSVGSSKSNKTYPELIKVNDHPKEYQTNSEGITRTFNLMCLFGFSLLTPIVLIMIWRQGCRIFFRKFDFFSDKHMQELEKPVVFRKTVLGGVFSVFFGLFAIFVISVSIMKYQSDNISETRALVPQIVLDKAIVAEHLYIELTYYGFGGKCTASQYKCSPSLNISFEHISYSSFSEYCISTTDDCHIIILFDSFSINSDCKISVYFEDQPSFASIISINISVSSSIPNKSSQIFTYIDTGDNYTVFKGTSPNIFNFEMIPTIFTSKSSQWPASQTGFHIFDLKTHTKGSLVRQELISTAAFLLSEIHIKFSNNAFEIQRKLSFDFLTFGSAMVGSIFGFMEIFALTLGFFEGIYYKIWLRMKRKIMAQRIEVSRTQIFYEFCIDEKVGFEETFNAVE